MTSLLLCRSRSMFGVSLGRVSHLVRSSIRTHAGLCSLASTRVPMVRRLTDAIDYADRKDVHTYRERTVPVVMHESINSPDHPLLKDAFNKILQILCHSDVPGWAPADDWFRRVIEETVPFGKRIRGMLLVDTYQMIESSPTPERLELAALAFWLIEMSQASGLILDDFVDRSQTRRGVPCWHLREDVGLMALYDVFLLEQGIYEVLRQRFKTHPYYPEAIELLHEVSFITIKGQSLDMLAERSRLSSGHVYGEIIKAKTAHYTFALPVRLALYLARVNDTLLHRLAQEAAMKIGSAFQVQDDFLDCYGDPDVIGKIGTDIVDGKCSWLYVTAMQLADESQRKIMIENYGKGDPGGVAEANVKAIYNELKLDLHYNEYINGAFDNIRAFLAECSFPFLSLESVMTKIQGRLK